MDDWLPLGILSSLLLVGNTIYSFLTCRSPIVLAVGIFCLFSLLLKWKKVYDFSAPSFWAVCLIVSAHNMVEALIFTTSFVLYYPIGRIYSNFSGSNSRLKRRLLYLSLASLLALLGGTMPLFLATLFRRIPVFLEVSIPLTMLLIVLFEFLRSSLSRQEKLEGYRKPAR